MSTNLRYLALSDFPILSVTRRFAEDSFTIIEEQKNKGFKLERSICLSGQEGTTLDRIVYQGRIAKICRKISVRIIWTDRWKFRPFGQ